MEHFPGKEKHNEAEAEVDLTLIIHQLIKLQLVVQFVFADLPVAAVAGGIHNNWHVQIVVGNINNLPKIFFERRGVAVHAQIELQ